MKKTLLSAILATALLTTMVSAEATTPTKASTKGKTVTTANFVRAETDMQMKGYIDSFKIFGRMHHNREMYDVTNQITIRPNTDTMYSFGVFDLSSPVTFTLSKTERYQSLMIVSEDHSIYAEYDGTHTLTQEEIGTKYVFILLRTFVDPANKADIVAAHKAQDSFVVKQKDKGTFEIPNWDKDSLTSKRNELLELSALLPNSRGVFGTKEEIHPVLNVMGATWGWGGLPEKDAIYDNGTVANADGKVVHTMTVKDVPVDGFWSVTVYNKKVNFDINERGIYSLNNKTASKNKDGSTTLQFGDCKTAKNCLDIMPGWNYIVRQYQPRKEILDGTWVFPKPTPKK